MLLSMLLSFVLGSIHSIDREVGNEKRRRIKGGVAVTTLFGSVKFFLFCDVVVRKLTVFTTKESCC